MFVPKEGGTLAIFMFYWMGSEKYSCTIDLYPLLRNYDVWGEIVGINWNTMACEWRDYLHSSSFFLRVSAVFHCLFFCEVSSVVFLSYRIVSRSDGN